MGTAYKARAAALWQVHWAPMGQPQSLPPVVVGVTAFGRAHTLQHVRWHGLLLNVQ